ncbi:hypothetical protein [Streptomyces sp. NPDC097619]|uniref:hypothetical protein n=1 Tax=Streptomyces sp. NPDC097619 TaxID=3157228 RepID=UPI0033181770
MAEGCVLLLTRRGDGEARAVSALLQRIGVPVRRLDADALAGRELGWGPEGALTLDGRALAPTVTWLRHFSARAAPAGPPGTTAAGRMALRDSWTALARQLALASPAALGTVDPGGPAQWARARAHGVRTPRGLVTTDPVAAAARLPADRYVVKPLDRHVVEPEPGQLAWFLPRILDRPDREALPGLPPGTPVVLQEYVVHETEYRVYLAGGELHAFEVTKADPADLWARPARVHVRHVPPPPAVAAAARALGAAWGLRYGAFDFLWAAGEPVFLEVNAHGDWRWFERKAGVDVVTRAAARTVRDLHWSAAGRRRPPTLLTFLGADPRGEPL